MPTVLVVDDSAVDRRIVRGLLERAGDFEIAEACDGKEALAAVEQRTPDVVITDIRMPELDGFELVAALKDEYPSVPVILMTGKGSEEIAARAMQHGAASYVPKVCLADDLLPTVERVLSAFREDRAQTRLMHHMNCCRLEFTLTNNLAVIRAMISMTQQLLRCLPLADEIERLRVGIAVEEGLKNAFYHGSLEIGATTPKPSRADYSTIAARRLYEEPYRNRRIRISVDIDRNRAEFMIRDDGPGFNHLEESRSAALEDQERAAARGLSLMHTIMDEVKFNDAGNEVRLVKRAVSHDVGTDETQPLRL